MNLKDISEDEFRKKFYKCIKIREKKTKKVIKKFIFKSKYLINNNNETTIICSANNKYDFWLQYDEFYNDYNYDYIINLMSYIENENRQLTMRHVVKNFIKQFKENNIIFYNE